MRIELDVYSFGVAGRNLDDETVTTAQAVRNLLEQTRLAEDVFGKQVAPRVHAELDREETR